jgi:hypothetical protein
MPQTMAVRRELSNLGSAGFAGYRPPSALLTYITSELSFGLIADLLFSGQLVVRSVVVDMATTCKMNSEVAWPSPMQHEAAAVMIDCPTRIARVVVLVVLHALRLPKPDRWPATSVHLFVCQGAINSESRM